MISWVKARLDEDAKYWKRLWSLRLTFAFGALTGAAYGVSFFVDGVTKFKLALFALNIIGYSAVAVARVWKQELANGSKA